MHLSDMHGRWINCRHYGVNTLVFIATFLLGVPLYAADLTKSVVAVSIAPQKYFVERIAGELVDVTVMVAPGQSPATYAPTPKQMARLNDAKLYLGIGVPFEKIWIKRIAEVNPRLQIVQLEEGIKFRTMEKPLLKAKHAGGDIKQHHHHTELDPHVWTNPRLVARMAVKMKMALMNLLPAQQAVIEQNYLRFAQDLADLDKYIIELSKNAATRQFMVFHPSWGYFADAYGLRQIPIESEGRLPGAKSLSSLVNFAKREQIKFIFVQQQSSQRDALTIARAIDAEVVQLDPLAENYIDNLKAVANAITGAVQ